MFRIFFRFIGCILAKQTKRAAVDAENVSNVTDRHFWYPRVFNVGGGGHVTPGQDPAISLLPLFVSVLQDIQRMKYGIHSATFGPRGSYIFLEKQEDGWWDRLCEPERSEQEGGDKSLGGVDSGSNSDTQLQISTSKSESESTQAVTPSSPNTSPNPSVTVFNIFKTPIDHITHTITPANVQVLKTSYGTLSSHADHLLSAFIAALQSSHAQLPRSWYTQGATYQPDGAKVYIQSRDEEWLTHVRFEGAVMWDDKGNELEA